MNSVHQKVMELIQNPGLLDFSSLTSDAPSLNVKLPSDYIPASLNPTSPNPIKPSNNDISLLSAIPYTEPTPALSQNNSLMPIQNFTDPNPSAHSNSLDQSLMGIGESDNHVDNISLKAKNLQSEIDRLEQQLQGVVSLPFLTGVIDHNNDDNHNNADFNDYEELEDDIDFSTYLNE